MIEPRIYRAAFVPAILAIVLTMFSLGSRPRPLPQGLAADVLFDGRLARQTAIDFAERVPDRRPGSAGDRAVAADVAERLDRRGFAVEVDRFSHAGRTLVNVVARRAGSSRRQLVVIAARDAFRVPDADGSASDTAALLELGRVFQGRPSRRTLVLASVDGSTLGDVGTTRLLDSLGNPGLVDAVLVMSDLGAQAPRRLAAADVVERLEPGRHRAAAHRGGVDPPRAGAARRRHRRAGAARAAVVPDRHRGSGGAARARLRGGADLGQRRPASGQGTACPATSTRTGSAVSVARRCAR